MVEREIPREQWRAFCDEFSRQHHGWRVAVDVIEIHVLEADPAAVSQHLLATEEPFQGITVEEEPEGIEIAILADEGPLHVTHFVPHPVRICFEQAEGGAHKGLRIDAATSQTTLVCFRAAALPEELDGMAVAEAWHA